MVRFCSLHAQGQPLEPKVHLVFQVIPGLSSILGFVGHAGAVIPAGLL
jgi:hypothetical protein